jgi:hypothetical protein
VRQLLSKLIAGGLSAAVILLWWPTVFPSDTVSSWLVRGVIWTLSFELMLHALAPVEEALWRTTTAGRVRDRVAAAAARVGAGSKRRHRGARTVLAACALVVPVALLAAAPARPLEHAPPSQTVRHVTEVKRIVKIERRRVTVPVPAAVQPAVRAGDGTQLASRTAAPAPRRAPARRATDSATPPSGSDATTDSATPATPPRSADPPLATQQQPTGADAQPAAPAPASQP